jgi:hypothetical protein
MRPNLAFGPIDSVAQYLLYVSVVVLGVLLPLLVQRWRTRREKAALLTRTLAALNAEVADNRRRVRRSRESFVTLAAALTQMHEHLLALRLHLTDERADKPAPAEPRPADMGINVPLITRTAWDVARLADALVLLPDERLKAYTRIYHLQELFERDRAPLLQALMQLDLFELPAELNQLTTLDARLQALALLRAVVKYQLGLAESMISAYTDAVPDNA